GTLGATALVGGAYAAMRESKRLKEEMQQHSREMAKGGKSIEDGSKHRERMEKFRYDTAQAGALTASINECLSGNLKDKASFDAAVAAVAEAEARTRIG